MQKRIIFTITIIVIIGISIFGYSQYKKEIANRPPKEPSKLTFESLSSTQIQLNWDDNSNNEVGFRIYRDGVIIAEIGENISTYRDNALKHTTTYNYEITAFNNIAETNRISCSAKTRNPALALIIDKIGVADNGEDYFREVSDGAGEVYVGIAVTDGKGSLSKTLPISGEYFRLKDNQIIDVKETIYSTNEIGDYLRVAFIGFEKDGGAGEELLCQALDKAVKLSLNTPSSIILSVSGVDFTDVFRDTFGVEDDFLGKYEPVWASKNDWGAGQYIDVQCQENNGQIGLRLWFSIKLTETIVK